MTSALSRKVEKPAIDSATDDRRFCERPALGFAQRYRRPEAGSGRFAVAESVTNRWLYLLPPQVVRCLA